MTGVDDATATFTGIANAIRSKTGKSAKMKITEMAAEINSISTSPMVDNLGASLGANSSNYLYGIVYAVWSVSPNLSSDITATLRSSGSGKTSYKVANSSSPTRPITSVNFNLTASLSNSELKSGSYTGYCSSSGNISSNAYNFTIESGQASLTLTLSDGTVIAGSVVYTP